MKRILNAIFPRAQQIVCLAIWALLLTSHSSLAEDGTPEPKVAKEPAKSAKPPKAVVRACFGDACEQALLDELDKAEKEVLVAIYSFTRRNVSHAIVKAAERGASVEIKYDAKSQQDTPEMRTLTATLMRRKIHCYPISMDDEHGRMHHKFVVIDGKTVVTGSYNFTTSASRTNYENLVIIESPEIAKAFKEEYDRIQSR